jgi:hypothetical protein
MTEEEIEIVAQEMAKIGGTTWYPSRTCGAVLRVANERYKDRARMAIATLERLRAGKEALNDTSAPQEDPPQLILAFKWELSLCSDPQGKDER